MNLRQTFPPMREWKYSFLMMGFMVVGFLIAFYLLNIFHNEYLLAIPIIFLLIGGFYGCYLQGKSYLKSGKFEDKK